jgi:type II secretory pathway pseudopilin PulG
LSRTGLRARRGVGLVEILISLILAGILGIAVFRLFISQTRFADMQVKMRSARTVSRASINFLLSEARMVETGNGVAAATAGSSITLRIPLAMGIVCGTTGGATVLSMLPTDSVMIANAALSGYAYRGNGGVYVYTEGATTITAAGTGICTAATVTTVPGGRVLTVLPPLPATVSRGTPVFLYQRVRYSFGSSSSMPGRQALWRTLEATNTTEELIAPFDASSSFRFYRKTNDTSDVAVPPLNEITGIELLLTGLSQKPRFGSTAPERASLRTAVFFVNTLQ